MIISTVLLKKAITKGQIEIIVIKEGLTPLLFRSYYEFRRF